MCYASGGCAGRTPTKGTVNTLMSKGRIKTRKEELSGNEKKLSEKLYDNQPRSAEGKKNMVGIGVTTIKDPSKNNPVTVRREMVFKSRLR